MRRMNFARLPITLFATSVFSALVLVSTAQAQLISHWALDDGGSSQTAVDPVSGNNLTLGGANTVQTADPAWITSSKLGAAALDFDRAAGTFADAPDSTSFSLTASVTIAAWVKRDSLGGRQMFLGKGDGQSNPTQEYWFDFENTNPNTIGWYLSAGPSYPNTLATVTDMSDWHHIAGVYDGATQKIYLDGAQVFSVAASGSLSNTAIRFTLGAGYSPPSGGVGEPFNGKLDDVGLWKNALSGPKVTALVSLANEPTLEYDLGIADQLFQAYDASGSVFVSPLLWSYTTGLGTPLGQVTLVDNKYYLRLDPSGAGLFAFNVIPEPSTLALFGIGLVGLAITRRRRRTVA